MGKRFVGKTAIVTGASRGIGLAIAQRLVNEGARVVITARKQNALDDAVKTLGGSAHALAVAGRADDLDHQQETVSATIAAFGSIDFLVNNTGINPLFGPLVGADLEAARKTIDVNVIAALSWVQMVHRGWMAEHGGAIVNISSASGHRPAPGVGLYGASKAMLSYLTGVLALELGPRIRVNAVAPAIVKTRFAGALIDGREDEVASVYPLKRLGEPEDIADIVSFLLSEEAGWITGQSLLVDGGVGLVGPG